MTSNELSDFELGHFFALLGAFAALPGRVRARLLIRDTLVPVYYSSTARTQSYRKANRGNRGEKSENRRKSDGGLFSFLEFPSINIYYYRLQSDVPFHMSVSTVKAI